MVSRAIRSLGSDLNSTQNIYYQPLTIAHIVALITVAPEMWNKDPYGQEVDMFSLGVLVLLLLTGVPPFDDSVSALWKNYGEVKLETSVHPGLLVL